MTKTGTYGAVFGALAVMTLMTVAAAHYHLGTTVGLLIAAIKASLVGVFFMHLKHEGRFTLFVALFPVLLFLVLLLLVLPDFIERFAV
jgi:cytochrome c oxidase subunit 4